ncbi:MAG TPA: hypothetical protein PKN61_09435 [Acidobacteriota bacterium]|nr:hypothetical protein [Acidobacteriota bacterium]HNR39252.1 hypothetical protein [Acidobacteriota bacterium]HNU01005.1 hypothetical protein [Acidobacteriota bacterium]HPB26716.1 hypothetical protein [Acidobacteriota bacterium]HQO25705.1 hypothetical protein [Acidobacteriota bacterium]
MKKIVTLIALLSLVAMGMVLAADAPQGATAPAAKAKGNPAVDRAADNPSGRLFVDADGDGVCDNYTAGQPKGKMNRGGKGQGQGQGDGQLKRNRSGQGAGAGAGGNGGGQRQRLRDGSCGNRK